MTSVDNVVVRYQGDLKRYARALSKGRLDCDELVQDCLVRALSRPDFWARVHNPRAYLLAILHNVYVDSLASRRRHDEPAGRDFAIRPFAPAAQIDILELRDLERALARLPRDQRTAITCIGLDGMSYREAADHMGIPLGTVMSRVSRARTALRAMID